MARSAGTRHVCGSECVRVRARVCVPACVHFNTYTIFIPLALCFATIPVHFSEIKSNGEFATLNDGQSVEFEVGEGQKGPCATGVVPL